jgi:hypothetical protein
MVLEVLLGLTAAAATGAASVAMPASAVGEYVRSDGFLHERLTLAAPDTFVYVEVGCVGGPTRYAGKAQVTPNRVSIQGRHGALEHVLMRVAWGERRYLVPSSQVEQFCAYVAGKATDAPLPYFLRAEDQAKPSPTKEAPSQCK